MRIWIRRKARTVKPLTPGCWKNMGCCRRLLQRGRLGGAAICMSSIREVEFGFNVQRIRLGRVWMSAVTAATYLYLQVKPNEGLTGGSRRGHLPKFPRG